MKAPIEGPNRPLQPADLASLERALIEVGAPVSFAAPVSEAELAALESAIGGALPDDVKTLYRWRNGMARLRPGADFLAAREAVEERAQIHRELTGTPPEMQPPADLLPLLRRDSEFFMVHGGRAESSPIYRWSYWHMKPTPVYASLLHMVKAIEQACQCRAFHVDYDGWHEDHALMRRVEDSFQPVEVARRSAAAVEKCRIARDTRAPAIERQSAVRELCYEPTAIPALIELLRDRDGEIVRYAAFALGAMHVREALPALLELLERDPRIAADALAGVLTPEDSTVVGQLLPLLFHADKQVRIGALQALAAIRSPEAVPAVIDLLGDRDAGLYFYAIRALANARDRRALEPLRGLQERCNSLGLDPVYRGGTRGNAPTPDLLRATIETALAYIERP